MNQITLTQLRDMSVQGIIELLPCIITASVEHGEIKDIAFMAKPNEVIVLSDLHPRIQAQLKNLELKARAGMPPVQVIEREEPQTETPPVQVAEEVVGAEEKKSHWWGG